MKVLQILHIVDKIDEKIQKYELLYASHKNRRGEAQVHQSIRVVFWFWQAFV